MYSVSRLITESANKIERPLNPRSNANVFEIITFSWILNLFQRGRKRDLEENDLYSTLNDHSSSLLGNKLEEKWRLEVACARKINRSPSLLRALIGLFGPKYLSYGLLQLTSEIIKMSQPLFVGGLLEYFNADVSDDADITYAYICATGLVLSMLITTFLRPLYNLEYLQCGMKMRIACCSVIYRKALDLSHAALGEKMTGQVINLISNDVNRFDSGIIYYHVLWIGPLQTILVTYFLWQEIGVSSLFGVCSFLVFIPLQGFLGRKISELRLKTAQKTDERVRLMTEIILGIQVIKMYTWEKPFAKLIEYARKKEIQQIRGSKYVGAILLSLVVIQTRFQIFITVLVYIFLGNYIDIKKLFVIISFYNLLIITMGNFFCQAVAKVAELLVSIKRIQGFLLLENRDGQTKITANNNTIVENDDERLNYSGAVVVSNATAKWTNAQIGNTLDNVNVTVKPGRLVAVIGHMGAGKSSLIQAITRELPLNEGRVSVRGVISYASQEPWLFTGSIRQNILFDSPMNRERYERVIHVCALNSDFERFPFGDKTIVGERGVNLSGGQKARINLARAVYRQADIYLLDDPLSAVDTCVGKHLFEKCLKDYLRQKTVILVTHQIQYLNDVDQIVLMESAKILADGSYRELQTSGFNFVKILGSSEDTANGSYAEATGDYLDAPCPLISAKGPREIVPSLSSLSAGGKPHGASARPNEKQESCASGRISTSAYLSYMAASGNPSKFLFCIFLYFLTQVLTTGGDYWLSYWVSGEEEIYRNIIYESTTANASAPHDLPDYTPLLDVRRYCVTVYVVLKTSMLIAIFVSSATFVSVATSASIKLHNRMFNAVTRATTDFFTSNSSGTILNRFSKDLGEIDDSLSAILLDCIKMAMLFFGIIFVVGLANIYLMVPTFILGVIFYYIRLSYLPTSRRIKRLEGVTRSPVFSHVNESLQGLTTIRAYKAEKTLFNEFDKHQDLHSSAWFSFVSTSQAFGLWLDAVCFFYISIVILSFLVIGNNTNGGLVGLAITQSIQLASMLQWAIKQSASLENQMTSVERVLEYTNAPQESKFRYPPDKIPPKEWPHSGEIVFRNFNLRHKTDAPYILKNINAHIRPMEKVGIVGRTGAGKSSIIGALFRLALNDGNIFIDDVEIHEIGLRDLRSKISIIPQEPILFSGTMRTNLDPFDEFSDHVLWEILDEVELKSTVENLPGGLNAKMSANGGNLSVGQKQLVCLARAVLRNNKILVLDEATANVDHVTDGLIQNTIKNKFQKCTVLTIAHRLNTVMDSDRVIVMDAGRIVEFDRPYNLLNDVDGFLYKMVEQTGPHTSELLRGIAAEKFKTLRLETESPTEFERANSSDGGSEKLS